MTVQPQPQLMPSAEPSPPRQGPRAYSLHREYGQRPDHTEIPQSFFLDTAPVDLADPPPQPLRERDERRAKAAAADPDTP